MTATTEFGAAPSLPVYRRWRSAAINTARRHWLWLWNWPRFSQPIWSRVLNRQATAHHAAHAMPLTAVQQRAVEDLQRDGIAVLDCAELFSAGAAAEYCAEAERVLAQPQHSRKVALHATRTPQDGLKYYQVSLWDEGTLDIGNAFVRFALSDQILGVVNGYMEMSARLITVDLLYTFPMAGPLIASQNWHRDPTDRKVVKVFLYLRDVHKSSGPFEFVPGSHGDGPHARVFPRKLPQGIYPRPDAVDRRFSPGQQKTYPGKAGTIVIVDTAGLHRGAHAVDHERYVYVAHFLSDGMYKRDYFFKTYDYRVTSNGERLSPAADYALGMWREHTARRAAAH